MNINEYQKEAARTLIPGPDFQLSDNEFMLVWCAIGLGGESGEVLEQIKKGLLHRHGLDKEKLKSELGDCCWYLAGLCTRLDISLEEVMTDNIQKLYIRYPNGYSSQDSIKRVDR